MFRAVVLSLTCLSFGIQAQNPNDVCSDILGPEYTQSEECLGAPIGTSCGDGGMVVSCQNVQLLEQTENAKCNCVGSGLERDDPHIHTFDNMSYDCHGRGEFVLAKSLDSPKFEVQARFDHTKQHGYGLVNKAFVANGDNMPKVQFTFAPDIEWEKQATKLHDSCPVVFHINDQLHDILDPTDRRQLIVEVNPKEPTFYVTFVRIDMTLSVTVRHVQRWGCYFSVEILLPAGFSGRMVGLMGTPNGDQSDDWMDHSGMTLPPPVEEEERKYLSAYQYCTSNWCLHDESTSLFHYDFGSFMEFFGCDDEYGILEVQKFGDEDDEATAA